MDKEIKIGQIWHVRIKDAQCLTTFIIEEITDLTVLVKNAENEFSNRVSRYLLDDLFFVELV